MLRLSSSPSLLSLFKIPGIGLDYRLEAPRAGKVIERLKTRKRRRVR